jgi:hypothetical protein
MRNVMSASIHLARSKSGEIKMLDLMEVEWFVYHKNGSNPTEAEFNAMMAECWGFFDVTQSFIIKRVETV